MIHSVITDVKTVFSNVFRITTGDGIVLDTNEQTSPQIGNKINFSINDDYKQVDGTVMHGIIFKIINDNIYVSFGGLIGSIPPSMFIQSPTIGQHINLYYEIHV